MRNLGSQGFQDAALGNRPALARRNEPGQLAPKRGEVRELAIDFGQVLGSDHIDRSAIALALPGQIEQRTYLIE